MVVTCKFIKDMLDSNTGIFNRRSTEKLVRKVMVRNWYYFLGNQLNNNLDYLCGMSYTSDILVLTYHSTICCTFKMTFAWGQMVRYYLSVRLSL